MHGSSSLLKMFWIIFRIEGRLKTKPNPVQTTWLSSCDPVFEGAIDNTTKCCLNKGKNTNKKQLNDASYVSLISCVYHQVLEHRYWANDTTPTKVCWSIRCLKLYVCTCYLCPCVSCCVAELTNVAELAGMKSPLPVTPYPSCHGISLFVIVPVFWVENNDQHLSGACHPFLSCPKLYPDLAMPPCWAHLARRPGLFVCPAQSMTLCRGDGEVAAAPDLTSHPSFCLMPGHWGCDDWITHIYSQ